MILYVTVLFNLFSSFFSNPSTTTTAPEAFTSPTEFRIPLRYDIHGIDVSHHQNYIDWDRVSEDGHKQFKVSFCFIKATEGVSINDTKFNQNWNGCKEVGIKRGAYHFFIPSVSAKLQAKNYINSVSLAEGDFAPVLDFEQESDEHTVAQTRANLKAWLSYVEHHYGIKPIIYTNKFCYNKYIKGSFKKYPLWIADYQASNIYEYIFNPNLKFWQYSEKGRVKGISGHVDCNAFLGQPDELDALSV